MSIKEEFSSSVTQLHAMEDYTNFQKDMLDLEHLQYISEWRERSMEQDVQKDPIFKCIYVLVIALKVVNWNRSYY